VQVVYEHYEFLIEKRCVFRLREDRLGHCCRHGALAVYLRFAVSSMQTILPYFVVDVDQILKF